MMHLSGTVTHFVNLKIQNVGPQQQQQQQQQQQHSSSTLVLSRASRWPTVVMIFTVIVATEANMQRAGINIQQQRNYICHPFKYKFE
jgi:hypothetical protein